MAQSFCSERVFRKEKKKKKSFLLSTRNKTRKIYNFQSFEIHLVSIKFCILLIKSIKFWKFSSVWIGIVRKIANWWWMWLFIMCTNLASQPESNAKRKKKLTTKKMHKRNRISVHLSYSMSHYSYNCNFGYNRRECVTNEFHKTIIISVMNCFVCTCVREENVTTKLRCFILIAILSLVICKF